MPIWILEDRITARMTRDEAKALEREIGRALIPLAMDDAIHLKSFYNALLQALETTK